ncbi:MAG: hypothetical protein LBU85_11805 [Treponema sp.]|jgi:hypothetical protein|nr:hypothetical protein [Treponema sp.]
MKKAYITVLLAIGINNLVFSQTETWLSFGFEYGNFWESSSDVSDSIKGYIGSPGINLSVYNFWNNGNIGLFVHDIFAFPKKMTAESNGVKTEVDLDTYDFMMQVGIIIGPGFRYNITDDFKLYFGAGLSFLLSTASYTRSTYLYYNVSYNDSYSVLAYNLGIGGDIGLKYDITDVFYLNLGSIIVYDFFNYTILSSSFSSSSASAKNYSMIHLRPYICIGFNFYRTNDNMGKPK